MIGKAKALAIRIGHPLRKIYWRIAKPEGFGVKVMAFDGDGRLLLVRHSYGRSDLWMLPGGAIDKGEEAEAAAARELKEETALDAINLTLFGQYLSNWEGKRDHVALFTCTIDGTLQIDKQEIVEARFFALDALPDSISAATYRRVEDWRQGRPQSDRW